MTDIKLDNVTTSKVSTQTTSNNKAVQSNTSQSTAIVTDVQQEGVTVTNHLAKLVNLLNGGETVANENSRVLAVKSQIQSGNYKVDINALSDKLLSSGIITSWGKNNVE